MANYSRTLLICVVLAASGVWAAGGRPWHHRTDTEVETFHLTAHKNTPPSLWPEEPRSPEIVERVQFKDALGLLCGNIPDQRLDNYVEQILKRSKQFEVDPFLLSALMYDQSRCWPTTPKRASRMGRYGLTRLNVGMHAPQIRGGEYRYFVREDKEWKLQTVKLDEFLFNKWKAAKPDSNFYFAAAILRVLEIQHDDLDSSIESFPHRSFVSHWFYGDRVQSPEPENRVLTARRMLLAYYRKAELAKPANYRGMVLASPLDGVPRLVLDYFGNKRGKPKTLGHRGIDLDGASGEPVRAIAAGRVSFAGVDLHGQGEHKFLTPKEAAELTNDEMGPGGLYVSINHGDDFGTIYMHLESLTVEYQDQVEAGQIIGTLGRSGTERSGPHLHLEFRVGTDRVDPAEPLAKVLVNPHM